jgi:hypothetical protein
MRELEEVAQMKVQEAIQSGRRSQQNYHPLQEWELQSGPVGRDANHPLIQINSKPQTQTGWLYCLLLLVSAFLQRGFR